MRYRADIDGLRALAVLPVVAFHAGISLFPGGYIGVDVFFVISGYLIGAIILSEAEAGSFSIVSFYERRVRRIVPALVGAMVGTAVLACLCLLPTELVTFAKSLLATIFFVSNIFFWFHSGYFDAAADQQPLLHTWSLAVEEQFYLVFPLFVVLVRRYWPTRLKLAIILVALASFVFSAVAAKRDPVTAFYLPHSRMWELLLGTILAMNIVPAWRQPLLRELASVAGIAMIIMSVFLFSAATTFPGVAALLPCLGTSLVIHAGRGATPLGNRLLALPPLVFVGLISYSLYLWHWPLIVFQKNNSIFFSGLPSVAGKILIIVLSIAAAAISWALIERPFRRGPLKFPRRALFAWSGAAATTLVVLAFVAIGAEGFPSRFSPEAVKVASYLKYDAGSDMRLGTCFIVDTDAMANFDFNRCAHMAADRKNVLLLGDSYAADLYYGLSRQFTGVNLMQITGAGCWPTLEMAASTSSRWHGCSALMRMAFYDFLKRNKVDTLLIAGSWRADNLPAVAETLDWAKSNAIPTILFGPKVQYDAPLPRIMVEAIQKHEPSLPNRHRPDTFVNLDRQMETLAQAKGIAYVSFFTLMCRQNACDYADDGHPLTFDIGHFTRWGSLLAATRLKAGNLGGLARRLTAGD